MIDPFALLGDLPPEWRPIAGELLLHLLDRDRPWLTPKERAALDAVILLRPYLVTNATGARCRNCRAVHPYLTLGCVERPFSGWSELLALVRDQSLRAVRLGDLVPISREQACDLAARIRARGYPFPDPPDPRAVEGALRRAGR